MVEHPLAKGPILDEYGTLTDPEQMRVVIRMLAQQLENFAQNPLRLLDSKQREAVYHQAITLHDATCPDCAEAARRGDVSPEKRELERLVLEAAFRAYVQADEEREAEKREQAKFETDMLLLSKGERTMMQALGDGPHVNPLFN